MSRCRIAAFAAGLAYTAIVCATPTFAAPIDCTTEWGRCLTACGASLRCREGCDIKNRDCKFGESKKELPARPKAPHTKVQPKVTPDGAEQPSTTAPNV
jgi:hypothetical protein